MSFKKVIKNHQFYWSHLSFVTSATIGLLFFVLSLVVNYFAGTYATARVSNSVKDILLDHLPQLDVKIIFIEGIIFFFFLVAVILFYKPQAIPFALKSLALFVFTRSFFIILTHLAPSSHVEMSSANSIVSKFTFGGDLFFSGHTGLPFLMALIFWDDWRLRTAFILLSVMFAGAVLLGHLHYSIDVFAAFFITYTVFHLAAVFFIKDFKRLNLREPWLVRLVARFSTEA